MKVAVTGHTNGIGQGLYNHFQQQGHQVLGFSRSNGFALPKSEARVLDQIRDCDVFVNNALPVQSQISMIKALWPDWAYHNKKIIVIGSLVSRLQTAWIMPPGRNGPVTSMQNYQQEKKELDELCNNLRYDNISIKCSLISIQPGSVATNIFDDAQSFHPPMEMCLSVAQVVGVVDYVLNSPVKIDDIVFRR